MLALLFSAVNVRSVVASVWPLPGSVVTTSTTRSRWNAVFSVGVASVNELSATLTERTGDGVLVLDRAVLHDARRQQDVAEVADDRPLLAVAGLRRADGHRPDVQSDQVDSGHRAPSK
ncbi:hypothetical protein [Dactylosporangium sp. NPDC048998]|uniref:hypothetical protein n=1 Tax=Dactylosporangium sp. NPDC048998 TaxID=3363976 RepID=UPI003714737B